MRRLGELVEQEFAGSQALDALLPGAVVHHRAHAAPSRVKGDSPEPAVFVGLDENVVLVRGRQRLGVFEVGVDGKVPEEGVPAARAGLSRQQRGLAAGVNHEAGGTMLP